MSRMQQAFEQQRQELERQRAELERKRKQLDEQQRRLEALAASIEAQQRQAAAAPTAPSGPPTALEQKVDRQQQQVEALAASVEAQRTAEAAKPGGLRFSGYANLAYQSYDFYANAQSKTSKRRGRADVERFVLAPSYDFGKGWSFFAEVEFEHGGTGATVEYEAEEAGEYEIEVEKGGEVVIEQLYLQYSHNPLLNVRLGELVVPVGMLNLYHQPTQYFTIERSLGETGIVPTVWHETGASLLGTYGQARYEVQLVTALDSTGFSGYGFVSGGMQTKFEVRNASAFAVAANGEYAFAPGQLVGLSLYTGDSAPNRPRDNLDVSARVTLAGLYGRYAQGPWTAYGQAMFGWLQNAAAVNRANLKTYNGDILGVSRTPVGSRANSYYGAVGYDLFSLFEASNHGRLDAFVQLGAYDTHAGTDGISPVPRYSRKYATLGLNYKPLPGIVLKAEYSHQTNDADIANKNDLWGLAAGFEF